MDNILISICIPEYNAQHYIDANLNSILAQTYENIEVILVDDASKDNTPEKMRYYVQKYPGKVMSYFSKENKGIGATKNKALENAKGDYVFFCDCDDILKPNCIEKMVEQARRDRYPDIVVDGFTRIDQDGNLIYERKYRTVDEAIQQSIPLFAKLYKRSFLQKNHILSPERVILEDVLYQARVLPYRPRVSMVDNCGYIWIKNLNSASHTRLKGFSHDALSAGIEYLIEGKKYLKTEKQQSEMLYYVMQFVAWHLLKSGAGAGSNVVAAESVRARAYLEEFFPEYKTLNYISPRKPIGTRCIVRWVVLVVTLVMKFSLERPFFFIYGGLNLTRLWPKL